MVTRYVAMLCSIITIVMIVLLVVVLYRIFHQKKIQLYL